MSCHGPGAALAPAAGAARVLLVGGPNVGKSTLFNTLTGARQTTMNAPGTTVELATGVWRDPSGRERVTIDLPGTHSLLARSMDEHVTAGAVAGITDEPGVVVVVVDATALARSLYLLGQVAQTGAPFVVALTMTDLLGGPEAARPGDAAAAMAEVLGVPVVPLDARRRGDESLDDLARAVDAAPALHPGRAAGLPAPPPQGASAEERAEALFTWVAAAGERLADRLGAAAASHEAAAPRRTASDRIDAVLLHPWAGIPAFLAVVWAVFELTTRAAAPVQDAIGVLADRTVIAGVSALLGAAGLGGGWAEGLLVDGLITGVVTVLTFVPVMGLMFLALGLLEDSGYLARAALVADRAMRALGLDGRALLPLVVGFGCNLPALAATRTLPSGRQRLLTGLLVPLTSCSARLTVYVLLASAFFPAHAGLVIFGMYVTSVVLVLLGGLLLRRTAFRDVRAEPLMLVLPLYRSPHLRTLGTSLWVRLRAFVAGAGTIIVATMLVVWVLTAIPSPGSHDPGATRLDRSVYGAVAEGVSPVLAPAGFGDPQASAALITGFVAKEVVVGSFAQSYAIADPGDRAAAEDLRARLRSSFGAASGGHGGAAALAFMVFVLAYTPCVAALAEQRRIFGWRPTAAALLAQLATAWALAVVVFQVGARL